MSIMEVTLQDIARELDLSATTVSRSLRHDTTITPETRARVHEVARRMDYKGRLGRPRRPAERDTSTRILGLLLRHRSLDSLPHDTNLMKMMAGIMAVTDEYGMHMKMHPHQIHDNRTMDEDASLIPPMVHEGICQALIAHGAQDERDLDFLSRRLPVVSIGRIYRDLPIDAAVADNAEGVRSIVAYLVKLGHRRLAWVGTPSNASFMEDREAGFMYGCRKYGLELGRHSFFQPEISGMSYSRVEAQGGSDIDEQEEYDIEDKDPLLAAVDAGVTGFVCGNDGLVWPLIKLLESAGKRVPHDVSVTGFDATANTASSRCPTGINPNFFEMGKAAAQLALQRMSQSRNEPRIVMVRSKLVIGDTTAPAPNVSTVRQ